MGFLRGFFTGASALLVIAYIGLICAAIYGYLNNIVILVQTVLAAGDTPLVVTGTFICRIIGIFAFPLGIILGFF